MKINEFINLLKLEFDVDNDTYITNESLLKDYFATSSLNILFLRGIVNENFKVVLTDNEIKSCTTINELYQKILAKIES